MRTQNAAPIGAARLLAARAATAKATFLEPPGSACLPPCVRARALAGGVLGLAMGLSLVVTPIAWGVLILDPLWGLAGALAGAMVGVLELRSTDHE